MSAINHRGLFHERTKDDCHHGRIEKAFAERWEEAQNPPDWLNGGVGTLAWLVTAELVDRRAWSLGMDWLPHPEKLTQRDADVAATVIQWLGTNVGFCWLSETLKKAGYDVVRRDHNRELSS